MTSSVLPVLKARDETFIQLCQTNPDLRLELTAQGELVIMAPTGSETGYFESDINGQLWQWNKKKRLGYVFGSSAGFRLPNGAIRSPDASWIAKDRWEQLTDEQQKKFAPICPDLVIELKSPGDNILVLQEKMTEYMTNGARLGWLFDPDSQKVYTYRPDQTVMISDRPDFVSGAPLDPDLVIDLKLLWE